MSRVADEGVSAQLEEVRIRVRNVSFEQRLPDDGELLLGFRGGLAFGSGTGEGARASTGSSVPFEIDPIPRRRRLAKGGRPP